MAQLAIGQLVLLTFLHFAGQGGMIPMLQINNHLETDYALLEVVCSGSQVAINKLPALDVCNWGQLLHSSRSRYPGAKRDKPLTPFFSLSLVSLPPLSLSPSLPPSLSYTCILHTLSVLTPFTLSQVTISICEGVNSTIGSLPKESLTIFEMLYVTFPSFVTR